MRKKGFPYKTLHIRRLDISSKKNGRNVSEIDCITTQKSDQFFLNVIRVGHTFSGISLLVYFFSQLNILMYLKTKSI